MPSLKSTLCATAGLLLGALMGASAAHAGVFTTTTTTVTFSGPTDFNGTGAGLGSLPLFNSSLGTLQSVNIGGTYTFSSSITVSNNTSTATSGNVNTVSGAQFSSSTSAALNSVIETYTDTAGSTTFSGHTLTPVAFNTSGSNPAFSLTSTNSYKQVVTAATSLQHLFPIQITNASDMLPFEAAGGGNFAVLFNTLTGTELSYSAGNASATQSTSATGTLTISYTYDTTPVPEPASLALFGVGVIGLGLVRRRSSV